MLSTWKSEADCCEWSGVSCSNLTGHVIQLALFYKELRGNIDSSLCDLRHLSHLNLDGNNFEGSKIPECIGSLGQLRELSISDASIGGTIPRGLQNLSSLEYLDLGYNDLIVKDLEWISHLSSLRSLYLSGVNLRQAVDWQSSLSKAPHLSKIYLVDCDLISHHFNPASFVHTNSSKSLKVLSLAGNNLDSSILPWLSNVSNVLTGLYLGDNALEHIFPNTFSNMNSLESLSLDGNSLRHIPSDAFPNLCRLKSLSLRNNNFSGQLSDWIPQLSNLYHLDISSNFLSGKLPDCWGQLPSLRVLRLENNHFSGPIPNSVGTLNFLASIHLNSNNLSGNLPALMNSSYLLFIDFGQNNLTGKMPSWIGQYCHNLIGLRLQANRLHGSIPTNLCNLPHLQILDLSKNNLTGNIPHCFGNLNAMSNMTSMSPEISYNVSRNGIESSFMDTAMLSWKGAYVEYRKNLRFMKTIDLSCNDLTGEIPSSIAALVALASLNLSRNHLKGCIPINMGQMERLESLDLSYNSLSGEIPISFSNLSFLSMLNLAFNNLSGKIPTGTQLQSFNASGYIGNQGLCGMPLTERCPEDGNSNLNPNNARDIDADGDDNLISFGFYASMALGFITGFWGVCGTLILKKSWRHFFFHFFENTYDWIYVQVAILKTKIKRRFQH
ncbi:receptor-like protein EIX1 [Neltuma alba]|uniref:receptor-like protein EIX1 n=1 Tax=Neltuma alba TaxID=207710 RepID=UPI0010A5638E|nr:receptor-like protein EIX1 [Prosopis alba]